MATKKKAPKKHWSFFLGLIGACDPAKDWAKTQPSYKVAWEKCTDLDWLIWFIERLWGLKVRDYVSQGQPGYTEYEKRNQACWKKRAELESGLTEVGNRMRTAAAKRGKVFNFHELSSDEIIKVNTRVEKAKLRWLRKNYKRLALEKEWKP